MSTNPAGPPWQVALQILGTSTFFGTFAAFIVALVALFDPNEINPIFRPINVPIEELNLTVDFIVVGAGSAGNVLANRLTEIPGWTVLLLEAGPDENVLTDVPLANYMIWGSPLDWNYSTTPQPNACKTLWNSTCYWPRGRMVGGSSAMNDFVALRGNSRDYDRWAGIGNAGWTYNECLPFFRRLEDNRYPPYRSDLEYHGVGGYQTIENPTYFTVGPAILQAGIELGYMEGDVNAGYQPGFMTAQCILRDTRRCSTGKAYLRPARNRTNLQVSLGSYVTKILISPSNMTAYGVEFTRDGRNLTAYARKEVLVSGGTVNSPQLLLLSGVGPKAELLAHNIPVIQDLPVGQNLQDHIAVPVAFTVNTSTVTPVISTTTYDAVTYALNRTGPLTSPVGVEVVALMNPPGVSDPWPPFEVIFTTFFPPAANPNSINIWTGLTVLLRPESRGTVTLSSPNPFDSPLINPNYLSTENDVNNMISAINNTIGVSNTSAVQKYNSTLFFEFYTSCLSHPRFSTAWFLCLTINYSTTSYHPVGTCAMSPSGVVDSRLRVYNISGLRVVDASVFPYLTSGNINIPVIMVAERASDFIRQQYNVTREVLHDGNREGTRI